MADEISAQRFLVQWRRGFRNWGGYTFADPAQAPRVVTRSRRGRFATTVEAFNPATGRHEPLEDIGDGDHGSRGAANAAAPALANGVGLPFLDE